MIQKVFHPTAERYLFLAAVSLNALPVLLFRFFPSMDGAAHLYNSRLILELLFGGTETIRSFYEFTPVPVPNWLGHFILSSGLLVLPAFMAEKVLLVLYAVGLPYAFRHLVRTVGPNNIEYSYFILPFCYSYLFTLGFYNFSLAIMIMFLVLAKWLRLEKVPHRSFGQVSGLATLLLLLYFAHIFVFGLTLFLLAFLSFMSSFRCIRWSAAWLNEMYRSMLPKALSLAGAAFIPLLLSVVYYLNMPKALEYTFVSRSELVEWVFNLRPLISYNIELEGVYTRQIFSVLVIFSIATFLSGAWRTFRHHKERTSTYRQELLSISTWWAICLIFLFLYLLMPDGNGVAGYMSIRLGLLLLMFVLVALSLHRVPKWSIWSAIVLMMIPYSSLWKYHIAVIKDQNRIAKNIELAGEYLSPGSVVYPVNRSNNWLAPHYSNYLGVNRPVVILENYEAGLGYFPLQWNSTMMPAMRIGPVWLADLEHEFRLTKVNGMGEQVDHIFVLRDGDQGNENDDFLELVLPYYDLIYSNEDCLLYRSKGDHVSNDREAEFPRSAYRTSNQMLDHLRL